MKKIIIDVETSNKEKKELKLFIDINADMFFELDGIILFKTNCMEIQDAIDSFHLNRY